MRYETEIHVSSDRYVCLQLPSFFPEGRAVVLVTVVAETSSETPTASGEEFDREDIEWWDEFGDQEFGQVS
jgi:hypothetical protein